MAVPKISVEDVSKAFPVRGGGAVTALDAISLDVSAGEFLVVVGPSGCGKSTLLDLLGGLTRPTSGRILLDGKQVTGPALDRGIVFQQYALFPWRTAQRNIEFGLEAKGVPRRERAEIARGHLELVGLSGFEDRYPHELSGGMKQRVAIARSLAYEPDVLLMDEPFAALDAQTRDGLQEELLRIWERTGKTVVFITHSIDEAVYLGTRVAVLTTRPGRIKDVVDIDLGSRHDVDDLRSTPEFAAHRHHLWTLLHNDTQDGTRPIASNGTREATYDYVERAASGGSRNSESVRNGIAGEAGNGIAGEAGGGASDGARDGTIGGTRGGGQDGTREVAGV